MDSLLFKIGVLAVLPLIVVLTMKPQALAGPEGNKRSEEIPKLNQEKNEEFSVYGVLGELSKIEGDIYVVKESNTRKEIRLKVTADTKVYGKIKVGQKIIASVSSNGLVLVITSLQ